VSSWLLGVVEVEVVKVEETRDSRGGCGFCLTSCEFVMDWIRYVVAFPPKQIAGVSLQLVEFEASDGNRLL
jgi:hypothetical protein